MRVVKCRWVWDDSWKKFHVILFVFSIQHRLFGQLCHILSNLYLTKFYLRIHTVLMWSHQTCLLHFFLMECYEVCFKCKPSYHVNRNGIICFMFCVSFYSGSEFKSSCKVKEDMGQDQHRQIWCVRGKKSKLSYGLIQFKIIQINIFIFFGICVCRLCTGV